VNVREVIHEWITSIISRILFVIPIKINFMNKMGKTIKSRYSLEDEKLMKSFFSSQEAIEMLMNASPEALLSLSIVDLYNLLILSIDLVRKSRQTHEKFLFKDLNKGMKEDFSPSAGAGNLISVSVRTNPLIPFTEQEAAVLNSMTMSLIRMKQALASNSIDLTVLNRVHEALDESSEIEQTLKNFGAVQLFLLDERPQDTTQSSSNRKISNKNAYWRRKRRR
jgi:hypothetical protein